MLLWLSIILILFTLDRKGSVRWNHRLLPEVRSARIERRQLESRYSKMWYDQIGLLTDEHVAQQANWSGNAEDLLFAKKSVRHPTIHGSCRASFATASYACRWCLVQRAWPIDTSHWHTSLLGQSQSSEDKSSKWFANCQFIVLDPVTPTQFLTTIVPTTLAGVECLIRSASAKTLPLDLLPTSILKVYNSEFCKIMSHCKSIVCCWSISVGGEDRFIVTTVKKPGLPHPTYKICDQ